MHADDGRLPAGLEVAALVRRTLQAGDHAAILHRGDDDRGALLLVVTSRGVHHACLERTLSGAGYEWRKVGPPESAGSQEIRDLLEKRARFDPDLWILELDVAAPQRFIAETGVVG